MKVSNTPLMETWNIFSSSDVVLAAIGFVGLISVGIVFRSAFGKVNTRERARRELIDTITEIVSEEAE
jgi:hypothetical protein